MLKKRPPGSRSDALEVHLAEFLATLATAGYANTTQDDKRRLLVPFIGWARGAQLAAADPPAARRTSPRSAPIPATPATPRVLQLPSNASRAPFESCPLALTSLKSKRSSRRPAHAVRRWVTAGQPCALALLALLWRLRATSFLAGLFLACFAAIFAARRDHTGQ